MLDTPAPETNKAVRIDYTNWQGVRSTRRILPLSVVFGATEWHPEPQWLLHALDLDKQAERDFAMRDIHGWSGLAASQSPEGHKGR